MASFTEPHNRSRQYRYYRVTLKSEDKCDIALEGPRNIIAKAEGRCEWAIGKQLKVLQAWRNYSTIRPI